MNVYTVVYCFPDTLYVLIVGQRTKKWKSLYFVLNASEQQLYYFDNQKVTGTQSSIC